MNFDEMKRLLETADGNYGPLSDYVEEFGLTETAKLFRWKRHEPLGARVIGMFIEKLSKGIDEGEKFSAYLNRNHENIGTLIA